MASLEATQNISRRMLQELDDFVSEINDVHMVWLKEIEQEAYRMFSGESNTEPELMPKTPSQKRRPRKKRISMALQDEARARRRFSKGRRSNLAAAMSPKQLQLVLEVMEPQPASTTSPVGVMEPQPSSTSSVGVMEPQPSTSSPEGMGSVSLEVTDDEQPPPSIVVKAEPVALAVNMNVPTENRRLSTALPVVRLSASDRRSAEAARPPPQPVAAAVTPEPSSSPDRTAAASVASPGRAATNVAIAGTPTRPRVSLTLRHSAAGLRHSLTRESVRKAFRRSLLKKFKAHASNSTGSEDTETEDADEHQPEEPLSEAAEVFSETEQPEQVSASGGSNSVTRASTRSAVANSRSHTADTAVVQSPVRASRSTKRKPEERSDSSTQKKVVRPNMKTFLQAVHRNHMLMTPNSVGRTAVMKSFIKHNTPLKVDMVAKERQKLEVLKKKQEQEEERMNKMEEEKKRKQEELKRKREERLKKAADARAKEEQKAEEKKKKKMEEKRAQMEKNDKLRAECLAEEKLKKQQALKHQEEIDSRRKQEEETRLKKIQQAEEEEKRQQALQAKRRAEEEAHRAHKLAEARRAQELKKEQERAERERAEALQREAEKAAREKQRKEAEVKERKEAEKRKALEDKLKKEEQQRFAEEERAAQRLAEEERAAKQRLAEAAAKTQQPLGPSAAGLNVTMDVESSLMKSPTGKGGPAGMNVTMDVPQSPQTYVITPKGANKTVKLTGNPDDYGMDQNSDDSTDDESAPRKPIPSWATGQALQQALLKEYFNPPDLHALFGAIAPPNLEEIFYTKKPRFNKRTSSAVWHSPPMAK